MSEVKRLGVSKYARHRKDLGLIGQSHSAVKRAIDRGTLRDSVEYDSKGRAQLDPVAADAEWAAGTDPVQQRDPSSARGRWSGPKDAAIEGTMTPELRVDAERADPKKPDNIRETQTAKLTFQTKLLELDYRERAGELCPVSEVDSEGYRIGRLVLDGMKNLVPRIAPLIAAESDQHTVATMLNDAIRKAMESLVPLIEKGPESAPEAEE